MRFENRATERLLGYRPEELIGRSAFDLIHPDDRAATFKKFEEVLATPEGTAAAEFRFQKKDGTWRYLAAVAKNLLHEAGIRGVVVNFAMLPSKRKQSRHCENRKSDFDN